MRKDKIILMYHSIGSQWQGEVGSGLYCVSVNNFREQMQEVHSQQCPAGHRQVIITFDDGDITNYKNAYPILKELGLKAYFFIIVSKVGMCGYMNWEQIKELKDAGMIIGSHGMTHKILTGLSEGDLDYELRISKKILEDELKCTIDYLSVPRGFYNQEVIEQAKSSGYKGIFTSSTKDNDGFKFGRIPVRGSWELDYFIKILYNGFSFKDRTEEWLKNSAKKILGASRYDNLRTRILSK